MVEGKKLTRQQMMAQGRCFNCGEQGHRVQDKKCKAPSTPQTRAAQQPRNPQGQFKKGTKDKKAALRQLKEHHDSVMETMNKFSGAMQKKINEIMEEESDNEDF